MNDYLKFFACAAVLCLVYPPFLGFVIGCGGFLVSMYVVYLIISQVN
jgi:hypothetical protein